MEHEPCTTRRRTADELGSGTVRWDVEPPSSSINEPATTATAVTATRPTNTSAIGLSTRQAARRDAAPAVHPRISLRSAVADISTSAIALVP